MIHEPPCRNLRILCCGISTVPGGHTQIMWLQKYFVFYCEILINLTPSFLEEETNHIIGQKKKFEKLHSFLNSQKVLKQSLLSYLDAVT